MPPLSLANFEQRATAQKGDFGIGSATAAEIEAMGLAWVGVGYRVAKRSKGKILISANGLRQYRRPTYKPRSGRIRANLESRSIPDGGWASNAHIDVL